jgi:hypothetical protein
MATRGRLAESFTQFMIFPQQEVTELPFEEVAIAYGVKPWR